MFVYITLYVRSTLVYFTLYFIVVLFGLIFYFTVLFDLGLLTSRLFGWCYGYSYNNPLGSVKIDRWLIGICRWATTAVKMTNKLTLKFPILSLKGSHKNPQLKTVKINFLSPHWNASFLKGKVYFCRTNKQTLLIFFLFIYTVHGGGMIDIVPNHKKYHHNWKIIFRYHAICKKANKTTNKQANTTHTQFFKQIVDILLIHLLLLCSFFMLHVYG